MTVIVKVSHEIEQESTLITYETLAECNAGFEEVVMLPITKIV